MAPSGQNFHTAPAFGGRNVTNYEGEEERKSEYEDEQGIKSNETKEEGVNTKEDTEGESDEELEEGKDTKSGGNVEEQDNTKEDSAPTDDDSEDDLRNKTFTINSNGNEQQSIEMFIPSDEEFPDDTFEVGRTAVSNYFNSKETIIDYSKIPDDIFEEGSRFRATPTSLNNKIVFIACNNNMAEHKPDKEGRKKFCELAPVCHIAWSKGDQITKVLIIDSDNHPRTSQAVWGCRHHAKASIDGVVLQTQRYKFLRADKPVGEVIEINEADTKEDENVIMKDLIKEGGSEGDMKTNKTLSNRMRKNKGVSEDEVMYDRIKKNGKKK